MSLAPWRTLPPSYNSSCRVPQIDTFEAVNQDMFGHMGLHTNPVRR